jgi:hypothetical protein
MRGIQYAANFRFYHGRHGILDRPLSRAATTEFVACAFIKHAFAFPLRDAPELLQEILSPRKEGVGNAGCPMHPQPRV